MAAFAANVNPPDVAPAPPKIVKQNDPPPQTVKRNAPAPKAKLELEDDWATMQIPQTPIAGAIRGKDFTPDKIALETGGLVFRQGNGVFADIEVRLFLFLKAGESPENKTYEIPPAAFIQGGSPRINISTKEPADELPKTEMISSRYALKLSFGAEMDGTLPGRIHLRLPDAGKSFLAGTFSVKTAAAAKTTPGAPTNPGAGPVTDGPPAPAGFRLVTGNDGGYQFLFPVKAKRTSTREQSIARGNLKGKSQINQCELADGTALIVAAEKLSGPALKGIEISELYDLTVEPIKKQGYDVTEAKEFLFGAEKGREYFFTKKGIVIRKVMLIRRDGRVFEMAVASGSQEQVTNATAETFIQSLKILAKGAANPP